VKRREGVFSVSDELACCSCIQLLANRWSDQGNDTEILSGRFQLEKVMLRTLRTDFCSLEREKGKECTEDCAVKKLVSLAD